MLIPAPSYPDADRRVHSKHNQHSHYCLQTTMAFQLTKLVIFLFWLHWKVKYFIFFEWFCPICLWTGSKSCDRHSVKTCTQDPPSSCFSLRIAGSWSQSPRSLAETGHQSIAHTLRASLESPAKLMFMFLDCKRKLENLEKTDPKSNPKPSALSKNTCKLGHSPQHDSKLSYIHRRCM